MPIDKAFQDLILKFDAAKGDALRKAERTALKAVGEAVQAALTAACPVDTSGSDGGLLKPGELKQSITYKVTVPTDVGTLQGKQSSVRIAPKGNAEQAVAKWLEYGHVARRGVQHEGPARMVPAHPFIRPVQDTVSAEMEDVYTTAMTTEIDKAFKE